ncbi:hypothetical protein ACF0H5_010079 [Mactra antiquata]
MRFGGKRIRICTSIMMLLQYILRNISGEIYCGAIFMQQLLGWNTYLSVCVILVVVAIYTVIGGLRAVIFTDTLQTIVLVIGCVIVSILSFIEVGGWERMQVKYMSAVKVYNYTNTSNPGCGLPREDAFHIFRDPVSGDIPWTGSTFGLTILAMFVWCQDQLIVQRCISAKNITHAKGGTLLAAALKFLSFPIFVLPGMISRILYTDEVACTDPSDCMKICGNPAGCTNIAYPLLVLRLLPVGIRGLMLAAVLAGLMSTLTSVFNSASSIVTLDLWAQLRKQASQRELMAVGRVTVLVLVVVSVLWIPILQQQQGGLLWFYIAAVIAYFAVPWWVAYMLGMFFKRTTEAGTFYGMVIGLLVGVIRLILDLVAPPPICGSDEPDKRWTITSKVDFLHFAIINALLSGSIMIVISFFTKPRTDNQLRRVTWWTRHDLKDPELTDDEDDDDDDGGVNGNDDIQIEENCEKHPDMVIKDSFTVVQRCQNIFKDWICGSVETEKNHVTKQERELMRRKMTSIKEGPWTSVFLNIIAVFLLTAITFLFGVFA